MRSYRVRVYGSTLSYINADYDVRYFDSFLDAVGFAEDADCASFMIERRIGPFMYEPAMTIERYNALFDLWYAEDPDRPESSAWRDSLTDVEKLVVSRWDTNSVRR